MAEEHRDSTWAGGPECSYAQPDPPSALPASSVQQQESPVARRCLWVPTPSLCGTPTLPQGLVASPGWGPAGGAPPCVPLEAVGWERSHHLPPWGAPPAEQMEDAGGI